MKNTDSISDHKKIEIITYFNHHHNILYELYFKPTFDLFLQNDFDLISIYADKTLSNNIDDYGYTKKIWQQIIVERFDIIIDRIKANLDPNRVSIFSDVDVMFFGNFYADLQPFINDSSLLLWYMPESINAQRHYINGGFFAFKHSTDTVKYFLSIKKLLLAHDGIKNDQPIIQNFLSITRAPYSGIMPYTVFNTNNCHISQNISLLRNNTLKVFHATSTSSVYSKILVLDTLYQFVSPLLLNQQNLINVT